MGGQGRERKKSDAAGPIFLALSGTGRRERAVMSLLVFLSLEVGEGKGSICLLDILTHMDSRHGILGEVGNAYLVGKVIHATPC